MLIRAVDDDDSVYKVPFSMKKVPGSFTGEVLCTELVSEISSVEKIKDNAATKIAKALKNHKLTVDDGSKKEYRNLHIQLKVKD